MSEWKGEFLGFTYGNIHSSNLGIVRVSDGSRFNENLLPTQQNRTIVVPGRDETYFFGSNDTQKQFNISYAFDSMTQAQLDQLRAHFADKSIRDLEFDERKGIIWKAKVSASSIKYIPFDLPIKERYKLPEKENWTYNVINAGWGVPTEDSYFPNESWYLDQENLALWYKYNDGSSENLSEKHSAYVIDTGPIYKGEGTLQLICYQPYGIELKTVDFTKTSQIATIENSSQKIIDWTISTVGFPVNLGWTGHFITLDYQKIKEYARPEDELDSTDVGLFMDSSSGLIWGIYIDSLGKSKRSKKIYNQFITGGTISKIPSNSSIKFIINWNQNDSNNSGVTLSATLNYKKLHY